MRTSENVIYSSRVFFTPLIFDDFFVVLLLKI